MRRSGWLAQAGSCTSCCGLEWELCKEGHLVGRSVLRQEHVDLGRKGMRRGVLTAAAAASDGVDGGQSGYTVQYTDGTSESICGCHAWLSLQPDSESAVGTSRVQALSGTLNPPAVNLDDLSSVGWDLSNQQGVRAALQALTPGEWSNAAVDKVATAVRQWECGEVWTPQQPAGRALVTQAGPMLVAAVDLKWAAGLIDACAGPDGSLTWGLEQCRVRVLSNCPDPTAAGQCFFHPLLPSAYSWLRKSGGCNGL